MKHVINMKKIILNIVIYILMTSASCFAQTLSVVQERQFNLDALRTIENYESYASLYGDDARIEFVLLFKDNNLQIFNDLNGLSAENTLSVVDYSEVLASKGRSAQVTIKNLRKGKPYFENDEWKIDVTFEKEISYTNACQAIFSSKEFFGADFQMQMTLAWDEEMRQCLITRLDGQNSSKVEMLPADYSILHFTDDRDRKIRANGDTLVFDTFGQAFLPSNPSFKYPDPDVRVKMIKQDNDCNSVSLSYKPKRWRIKAHYDMSIGHFYTFNSNFDIKTPGYEMALDFGYILPSRSKIKWGLFLGVGLSRSKFDMNLGDFSYYYQTEGEADIDQDRYVRLYSLNNVSHTFQSTDLLFPLYLDMDARISKRISIYFDGGIKAYINMKHYLKFNSGSYSTWGYYNDYGIEMHPEDNWYTEPINGFVKDKELSTDFIKSDYKVKKFSLDGLGRAGFRILLYKDLFLDLAAAYQMSIISPFNSEATSVISEGQIDRNQALMTYIFNEGETMHRIQSSFSSAKRQSLNVNIGLMIRF